MKTTYLMAAAALFLASCEPAPVPTPTNEVAEPQDAAVLVYSNRQGHSPGSVTIRYVCHNGRAVYFTDRTGGGYGYAGASVAVVDNAQECADA